MLTKTLTSTWYIVSAQKVLAADFSGGSVVKNLPAGAQDTGSIPGPGRSHMLWSNEVWATEPMRCNQRVAPTCHN